MFLLDVADGKTLSHSAPALNVQVVGVFNSRPATFDAPPASTHVPHADLIAVSLRVPRGNKQQPGAPQESVAATTNNAQQPHAKTLAIRHLQQSHFCRRGETDDEHFGILRAASREAESIGRPRYVDCDCLQQ